METGREKEQEKSNLVANSRCLPKLRLPYRNEPRAQRRAFQVTWASGQANDSALYSRKRA